MEVNARMGTIVATPTAGSSGILPAILFSAEEELSLSEEDLVRGLLVAAGVGQVIVARASVSGAAGGCQAETGSAAAMARGGVDRDARRDPRAGMRERGVHLAGDAGAHLRSGRRAWSRFPA